MNSSEKGTIGVGVVGFGLAGRAFHTQVIRAVPGLELRAILQRTGNEASQAYPDVCIVRSMEELLAMTEIQLVVIATPNETHFEFAKQCFVAGKDVVVDKPFTTTMEEAIELVRMAKEKGRLLTVYQNRRYDGDFAGIRELVRSGQLGRMVLFETNYDRYRPNLIGGAWRELKRPGAGILADLGPHVIDHAMVLFGVPQEITADIRVERDNAVVDDAFDITMHYEGAMRAVLRSSILAVTPRPRFVLHGTKGSFVKVHLDPQEANLRRGVTGGEGSWGADPVREHWGLLTIADGTEMRQSRLEPAACDYRNFYGNVRDAMWGKEQLDVSPDWALKVMQVIELARESSREKRTVAWREPSGATAASS